MTGEGAWQSKPSMVVPKEGRHPYYVYAPPYVQFSAGIRALHLLCHWLNRLGYMAFFVPMSYDNNLVNYNLLTPILTPELARRHRDEGRNPIAIYPEIVSGNPLGMDCIARYVLNVPGLLGGDTDFSENEIVWAYSSHLASLCNRFDGVLHMPVIDESLFYHDHSRPRSGAVFYASKFQSKHGQKVFGLPDGAIEITRGLPGSQTSAEVAALLQGAEVFYCFENTALATEAVLCGCPAVFMPNDYLEKPIAVNELGWEGYALGNEPNEIYRAKTSVAEGQANYRRTIATFFDMLDLFILQTQARAAETINDRNERFVEVLESLSKIELVLFQSRTVAKQIRQRENWRFHDWFRVQRALFSVAISYIVLRRYFAKKWIRYF